MRTFLAVLGAVILIAVGIGIGLAVTRSSSPNPPAPSPSASPTGYAGNFCYTEVVPPKSPAIWLETPKTGGSEESCTAIENAAQADTQPGTVVQQTHRPTPSVVIYQRGTLTVLAIPGSIPKNYKQEIVNSLNQMLPNG